MKTALFFLLLTATLALTGCSHHGMHHYYRPLTQTSPDGISGFNKIQAQWGPTVIT